MHPEAERRQWQNPESVLALAGLKPTMTFVDLGCGNGFFALPAARAVGAKGRVYGVDASPEFIEELRTRAEAEGLKNLTLTTGRAEETLPCEQCADIVFMGNVLHDFDDPAQVLANARKMLKPTGVLVNVDWKDKPSPMGPPMSIRFSAARASGLIENAGFSAGAPQDVGSYHYLILARPRSE
ncbi:MAG TPA: class I SAM-dependent methyltransferase [bacterium]|nr:class I SAM-dependent methyltransferase [bacterium]